MSLAQDWDKIFDKIDKNNNNVINKKEAQDFLKGKDQNKRNKYIGWLKDADSNNDNKVTKGEWDDWVINMGSTPHNSYLSPYEPTRKYVSKRMIQEAEIQSGNIVYDLGCGDARILLQTIKKHPDVRAIGVDIMPKMIKRASKRVQKYGLSDKITLINSDILSLNYSDADVIFTFLTDYAMKVLKNMLREQMKPTARLISHGFPVPGWRVKKEVNLKNLTNYKNRIYVYHMQDL